jgi:hypothetical protein
VQAIAPAPPLVAAALSNRLFVSYAANKADANYQTFHRIKMNRVFVVGVGMTKFEKPGARDWDYPDMVKEAGEAALADARINYKDVKQVVAGWVYGDSTAGQRAVYVEHLQPRGILSYLLRCP